VWRFTAPHLRVLVLQVLERLVGGRVTDAATIITIKATAMLMVKNMSHLDV
jgi:hypothetical protein